MAGELTVSSLACQCVKSSSAEVADVFGSQFVFCLFHKQSAQSDNTFQLYELNYVIFVFLYFIVSCVTSKIL